MIDKLIRHLQHEVHVTSVVVTHDMRLATEVGDRILLLWGGRFIADGPPDDFRRNPNDRVRRFVDGQAEAEDVATLSEPEPPKKE